MIGWLRFKLKCRFAFSNYKLSLKCSVNKLKEIREASASRLILLEQASLVVLAKDSYHKHSSSNHHLVNLVQAVASPSKVVSSEMWHHLALGVPSKPVAFLDNRTQLRRLPHSAIAELAKLRRQSRVSLGELQEALVDLDSHRLNQVVCLAARASQYQILQLQASRTLHNLGVSSNNSQLRVLLVKWVEVCFPKVKLQHNLDLQPHLLDLMDFLDSNNSNRI